jgi:hypothetical protein
MEERGCLYETFHPTNLAMKFCLRTFLLFQLLLPAIVHASTTAPMFAGSPGLTLTIHSETFNWTSPATEDGTWHTDTYTSTTDASLTLTVKGLMSNPNLATVTGSGASGTVNGYLSGGTYGDSQYSFDGDGNWTLNGVSYTHRIRQDHYSVDFGNWLLVDAYDDQYSGQNGNLHLWGNNDYNESHIAFTNGKTPFSSYPSLTVFGTTYSFTSSASYADYYEDADDAGWTDTYTSVNGDGSSVQLNHLDNDNGSSYYALFWHPRFGNVMSNAVASLPSTLDSLTWNPRTAPAFARAQLWLDGSLLNWKLGTMAADGTLTDTYSTIAEAGSTAVVTLTISAPAIAYFAPGSTTAAAINLTSGGTGTGTLAQDGSFTLSSGQVLQNAIADHSAPLFSGTVTSLKVNFSNYTFTNGFQTGNSRVDVFGNSSLGFVTLSGTVDGSGTVSVQASVGGDFYTGSFATPFALPVTVTDASSNPLTVAKSTIQPQEHGPPAFWVRGEFYTNSAAAPTSYVSSANAGHSLTFSGSSGVWTLQGADGSGHFDGQLSGIDPVGILLVQAVDASNTPLADAAPVPVIPANADGTLHLDSAGPGGGMPPAVRDKDGHILVYLGSAVEDTNSATSAAYYGCATVSALTPWLLKLRTDGSGTATYTDYSTATSTASASSTAGSYSIQTHLFQTGAPGSGFPMPVYGVDPNANFALWGLTQPDAATGLPATFLVNGAAWRYTGTAPDGTTTYQGYYTHQQMAVSVPDAVTGLRTLTVTDPVAQGSGGPTQGILSNVRGSAVLSDGGEVVSGNFNGQQINPTLNQNNLQTLAGDLDITGNVVTFGALTGGSATAGVALQFQDISSSGSLTASLSSILSRPLAQWQWTRAAAAGSGGPPTLPVMQLDASSKLTLYDHSSGNAGVVLDPTPNGVSTIRGVLRVRPGGDIDMGEFKTSPTGSTAP